MCGLRSKLLIPEFCDSILKYDIFACLETKLDEFDQINVDGYKFISKIRKQKALRKSGGIGVFVNNSIYHLLTEISTECEYVLWFKLDKSLFCATEDVYFGVVYVPPDNTKFFSRDIFYLFCNEVDHFTTNNQYVVLLGDFNARIGLLPDINVVDTFIYDQVGISIADVNNASSAKVLPEKVSLERVSRDVVVNRLGAKLIDLCKSSEMVILNGRSFSDINVGKFTCKNASVVDYTLCTMNSIQFFTHFDVKEFCPLSSDIHCSIEFAMKAHPESIDPQIPMPDKVKHWKNDKKLDFLANIDLSTVSAMSAVLDITDNTPVEKDFINNAVDLLSKCLLDAAKKTFGEYPQSHVNNVKKRPKRLWFDNNCNTSRKKFQKVTAHFY